VACTAPATWRDHVRAAAAAPHASLDDYEATVRASLIELDPHDREQLGQSLFRQAEWRGLVLRLGFDELSGAARLGELAVLTSMLAAIHRFSPDLLEQLLAPDDDPALWIEDAARGYDRTTPRIAG